MADNDEILRYDKMVHKAMRIVVKSALEDVIEHGLPGDHHFYITFFTDFPGVEIPDYLRERYPGEMTIVLQYQFSNLYVDDETMKVRLSFNNKPEDLIIPLAAISTFADPAVNFALQFQPRDEEEDFDPDDPDGGGEPPEGDDDKSGDDDGDQKTGEVVSLDQFRKK